MASTTDTVVTTMEYVAEVPSFEDWIPIHNTENILDNATSLMGYYQDPNVSLDNRKLGKIFMSIEGYYKEYNDRVEIIYRGYAEVESLISWHEGNGVTTKLWFRREVLNADGDQSKAVVDYSFDTSAPFVWHMNEAQAINTGWGKIVVQKKSEDSKEDMRIYLAMTLKGAVAEPSYDPYGHYWYAALKMKSSNGEENSFNGSGPSLGGNTGTIIVHYIGYQPDQPEDDPVISSDISAEYLLDEKRIQVKFVTDAENFIVRKQINDSSFSDPSWDADFVYDAATSTYIGRDVDIMPDQKVVYILAYNNDQTKLSNTVYTRPKKPKVTLYTKGNDIYAIVDNDSTYGIAPQYFYDDTEISSQTLTLIGQGNLTQTKLYGDNRYVSNPYEVNEESLKSANKVYALWMNTQL